MGPGSDGGYQAAIIGVCQVKRNPAGKKSSIPWHAWVELTCPPFHTSGKVNDRVKCQVV